MRLIPIPKEPLARARLAFLGLAVVTIASSALQLIVLADPSIWRPLAGVGLGALLAAWIHLYRSGRASWWIDLIVGGTLFAHASALAVPDLGLAIFYVAIYVHAFYGDRRDAVRAGVFILVAYLGAEIRFGFYESEILVPFVSFQVPALLVTGVILRALHESLISRRQLSEELERMIQMEAVTRLTGGIAHDFNNLLTAIAGSLDLALEDLEAGHRARPDVVVARETADRAASLTKQLLSFSRNAIVKPEPVDVDAAVVAMTPLLRHLAGDAVDLNIELDARGAEVMIDPPSFEQVLSNLVVNGREAMQHGEGAARLTVRTTRVAADDLPPDSPVWTSGAEADDYVVLSVTDSGPGMSDDIRERVFDPFFTTKKTGTGLGLSTVYGIVTQAGGQVDLESMPDRGTTVRVLLPVLRLAAAVPGV